MLAALLGQVLSGNKLYIYNPVGGHKIQLDREWDLEDRFSCSHITNQAIHHGGKTCLLYFTPEIPECNGKIY